ncbi:PilX N-terminal domain-containing pilus assembly protein [Endozoicomonas sp. ONNA1]|uniref:PilX N-terminal domain-containing pilus assembly protein n=1 Tax=Endozoicomonas sp. ONNA1 TaxID=2828740 RepID=UPI0021495DA6|nr:PilX N-terminal domain-containing pilus assembly protein [Endozoicomonas sp. ONNA1]
MNKTKQDGAILFVSLIILLLITIVAIGSSRLSTNGQRISFNYQLKNSTFQTADSSLIEAQVMLSDSPIASEQANDSGGFSLSSTTTNSVTGLQIQSNTNTVRTGILGGNSLSADGSAPKVYVYTTEATSELTALNISTVLEEGFIKPDVVSN